uniref:Ionotropic glutamate receptor L-glutamate and glycine-binding domain-containing protein n=1 Tax=Plectus sambesii TaxID=2011161 RepID=A0A914XBZ6_9BILA
MPAILKIAAHPGWFPESGQCALDGFDRRLGCKMPGYGPEMLDIILSYMKIPYEIIKLPADAFGGELVNGSDSSWNGILGDLQSGVYDIISAPYIITEERSASFDFSFPINSIETMFVVGPDQPDFLTSSFRLFLIFDPNLTVAVVSMLLVLIVGVFISQVAYIKREDKENSILQALSEHLLDEQITTSGKIFAAFLGFSLLLFTGLYEGCLLTYLLLPQPIKLITESELLDRVYEKKLTFATDKFQYDGYGNWQLVRFSKLAKYRKFQETLQHNPPLFTKVDPESLKALFEEHPADYVYYGESTALALAKSGCSLQVVPMSDPDTLRSGFIFRKNSSLVNLFNEAINRNWNFVLSVRDRYMKLDRPNCAVNDATQVVPLTLVTLLGSFTLLTIGISLPLIVVIATFCSTASLATSGNQQQVMELQRPQDFSSSFPEQQVQSSGSHPIDSNGKPLICYRQEGESCGVPVMSLAGYCSCADGLTCKNYVCVKKSNRPRVRKI